MKKKIILLTLIAVLMISIPLTLLLTQKKQETQSRASGSTTLAFIPESSPSSPIQKNLGDPISIDIMVNPGNNLVSFVKLQVKFDSSKIALADSNAFIQNLTAFPVTMEGPVTTGDTIAVSVSVGSDPTKSIQTTTKLGTLNLKTIGRTTTEPTQITFTTSSQALSSGQNDQAAENILSTTIPAYINVFHSGDPTVTPGPTAILTSTPTATPGASITPEPTLATTNLSLNILLHGIGAAGDNPNPNNASMSNKTPLHPQRNISAIIIDSNNQEVKSLTGSIIYDDTNGIFTGSIDLGPSFPSGNYNLKIKSDKYLRKLVPGIINISNLKKNDVPQTALVSGDIKDDNTLNVLDYNILLDCGYGALNPLPLADPNSIYNNSFCVSHNELRPSSDLDDNGIVNSADYNLFIRELSVQNGD